MPVTSPATLGAATTASARRGVAPVAVAPPRSIAGQAALRAATAAQQQYGGMPGMQRFFQQPGMSAANPAVPRATMHSGPPNPGMQRAYMSLLGGQQSNPEMFGGGLGVSLRDSRALYGGNPSVGDSSNLRYLAPLMGLQHVYSGQGSGQW
jgi:hypothetical protein